VSENILGADDRPRFFIVDDSEVLELPEDRHGLSVRAAVRSLSGMQKEALVRNGTTGLTWRLVSDEGPYLDGFDEAPCPLSFLTTGMVSMFADQVVAAAEKAGVDVSGLRLTLDNRYTMEGSARAGTMTGGALEPTLHVEGPESLVDLVPEAVGLAPITALVRGIHESHFTLVVNGTEVGVGRVNAASSPTQPDPSQLFTGLKPAGDNFADVIVRQIPAEEVEGVPGGVNTSLAENQSRLLHIRGVCTIREDGVKEIVQNLFQPIGSQFRFLSQEAPSDGSTPIAPDAATYLAAGIGFCFMTQFGRYARIMKKDLGAYRIVQDTFFSAPGEPPLTDPVETHVHLETTDGVEFGRQALDMSEQTCFLHALCRTDLDVALEPVPV
jgi:hypothetical protein